MQKSRFVLFLFVLCSLLGILAPSAFAQTVTPLPEPLPTESPQITNAAGYRIHAMPDIGSVEYPLAFYSVWNGVPGGTARDGEIFFPGVITFRPNDSVIYGVQFDTAYQIRIAMSEATGELDASLLGTGPLMQYDADLFNPDDVQQLSLNGVLAFRIDNIPVGPQGELTMHIVAVVQSRLIEIVVEPVAEVGGSAIEGLEIVNQIISSIVLEEFE